jgi:hypothetical protein
VPPAVRSLRNDKHVAGAARGPHRRPPLSFNRRGRGAHGKRWPAAPKVALGRGAVQFETENVYELDGGDCGGAILLDFQRDHRIALDFG